MRVESGGVGAPKVWFLTDELVGEGDVSPGWDLQPVLEGVVLQGQTVRGYYATISIEDSCLAGSCNVVWQLTLIDGVRSLAFLHEAIQRFECAAKSPTRAA